MDKRLYILETSDDPAARAAIERAFPALRAEGEESLSIYGEKADAPEPSALLGALEAAGIEARCFARSEPSLAEAMKAAVKEAT